MKKEMRVVSVCELGYTRPIKSIRIAFDTTKKFVSMLVKDVKNSSENVAKILSVIKAGGANSL